MSVDFNRWLYLPAGWTMEKGGVNCRMRFQLGDVCKCMRDGYRYQLDTLNEEYHIIKPGGQMTSEEHEQFTRQFPTFPYRKDEYFVSSVNERISRLENRVEAIISHFETIMVMLGERTATADPMELISNS